MAGDELEKCGWESDGSGGFARRPGMDGRRDGRGLWKELLQNRLEVQQRAAGGPG